MKLDFTHLHIHNDFSTYDGMGKAKLWAEKAVLVGQKSLAITNHGNISGFVEFFHACKDAGIKPILGVETYIVIADFEDTSAKSYHLCLLVKNKKGYVNLMKLMTKANLNGFYRKPRINLDLLEEHSEGLICSTACMVGLIPNLLNEGRKDEANKYAKILKGIFKDDLYFEVMSHGIANQNITNKNILKLANKMDIKCILTMDSHYVDKEDFEVHKSLVRMKNDKFGGYKNAYLCSCDEMIMYWKKYHNDLGDCYEYIKNTSEVADKCNVNLDFGNLMPEIGHGNSYKLIKNISVNKLKSLNKYSKKYIDRFNYELEVIFKKGYCDYFLICYDVTDFALKNNILTGFGRGSVGGSLVAYCLGLTQIDPLIHGTLFERFLREDKITMPDIDMDFDAKKRYLVVDYLLNKFEDKAAQIISFGKWQTRNTIGDLCKVFDCQEIKDELIENVKSVIGDEEYDEIKVDDLLNNDFLNDVNKRSDIIKYFCKMYGQMHLFGKHASGVAICKYKIKNVVSLMKNANSVVTAFDKHSLEKMNILKLDILGLSTLSVMSEVEKMTGCKYNEDILINKKVIKSYKDLNITGIFQFDSYGGRKVLELVKPDNFDEIVACTSINRPGPLQMGVIDKYILGKDSKINKDELEPWDSLFKETYGQIIYQEQVMRLCKEFANMEWPLVDKMMKNFKKGNSEKELRKAFVVGMVNNGFEKNKAKELYSKITSYSFNKSHAVAYIILSFYMMWASIKYPLEFYFSLLKRETEERKIRRFESCAAYNGIVFLLAHVNGSADYAIENIEGGKVIRIGLRNIDGVGEKIANEIIKNGPYNCEELLTQRLPKRIITSAVLEALRNYGALEFNKNLLKKRYTNYNGNLVNLYNVKYSKGEL